MPTLADKLDAVEEARKEVERLAAEGEVGKPKKVSKKKK